MPQPLLFLLAGLRLSQRGMFHPAKSILASEGAMIDGITGADLKQSPMAKPIIFALNGLKGSTLGGLFHPVIPNPAEAPGPSWIIQGTTKDEVGTAAAGYKVYLFNMTSGTPILEQTAISDGSGLYSFTVQQGSIYWVISYKSGTPDKTGATLNTLTGVFS